MALQATLPVEVKILAGRYEDSMATWVQRDPGRPRFETRRAGERARRFLRDLIDQLVELDGELAREISEYGKPRS